MPEEDSEKDAILNEAYGVSHAEFVRPSDEEQYAPPAECERCGSPHVERVRKMMQFVAATILILIVFGYFAQTLWAFFAIVTTGVIILIQGRWRCIGCGYRWT